MTYAGHSFNLCVVISILCCNLDFAELKLLIRMCMAITQINTVCHWLPVLGPTSPLSFISSSPSPGGTAAFAAASFNTGSAHFHVTYLHHILRGELTKIWMFHRFFGRQPLTMVIPEQFVKQV